MKKIAFIGAGSFGFTYKLVTDILAKPALSGSRLSFMDVNAERLSNLKILMDSHFASAGYTEQAEYTLELEQALKGADYVVNLVKIGFLEASVTDMDIPKKYGLYQTIGDTCCAAGVSRGMRTIIFLETLLHTMERVSNPGAVVLNYTNPQQINVMAASRISSIPFIGLCHSVQGTTRQMAKLVGVPYDEITYDAAGINHLSFILRFERDGEDLYPLLRQRANEKIWCPTANDDQIFAELGRTRTDLMNRFGYLTTESSVHLGEYVPYYLTSEEMRTQMDIPIDRFKKNIEDKTKQYEALLKQAREGTLAPPEPSIEYGAEIINAMETNIPCKIYGNVINCGLIDNLPRDACVEVACLADRNGVRPCHFGSMPPQLAMLCEMEISVHRLAVEGTLRRDPQYIYWALMADPVCNSILKPNEILSLTNELIETQLDYLPGFEGKAAVGKLL